MRPHINKINTSTGNQQEIQAFTNKQIYSKGFEYNVVPGAGNEFSPNLGGKARFLYGIGVYNEMNNIADLDKLSLTLNSEVIVDKVLWMAYNPQGASGNIFKTDQFFALPRILSGSDAVQINWESINAHKVNIVFYLSDVRPENYPVAHQ